MLCSLSSLLQSHTQSKGTQDSAIPNIAPRFYVVWETFCHITTHESSQRKFGPISLRRTTIERHRYRVFSPWLNRHCFKTFLVVSCLKIFVMTPARRRRERLHGCVRGVRAWSSSVEFENTIFPSLYYVTQITRISLLCRSLIPQENHSKINARTQVRYLWIISDFLLPSPQ